MADEIQTLIDSLRRGQYEDPTEKIGLLSAALQEQKADAAFLLNLLRAPQIPLRLAAVDACRERREPEIAFALVALTEDPDARVRLRLAEILKFHSGSDIVSAVQLLLKDAEENVREAAVKSTAGRAEFRASQQAVLATDPEWKVRLASVNALELQKTPQVVGPLFDALANESDDDVRRRCGEIIERRLNDSEKATETHLPTEITRLLKTEKALKFLGAGRFPKLIGWITARTTIAADLELLDRFGTNLTALAANGTLPHAHWVGDTCETVLKLIQREPWRSLALLGLAGVGKTALVFELVHQLAKPENGAWIVLRVSPADFMSGTKFLGEWETKVNSLVAAIKKPRRVILYVPNLSDLSAAGTWTRSESSVATALAPYLEEGSVLLLGESAPQEFERGLGAIPSLARLFDKVLLNEPSIERTRDIVCTVRNEAQSAISDVVLDQLMEVSGQFLSHISRPGNAVELLKSAIQSEKESGKTPVFRDVLQLLSQSTGLPVDLLDDAIPFEGAALREFFERKIIGQPEAVDAVVDLVTLIKAGVTDPNKPFGVFLFVGPTGVGKTELARALAEFIFGDSRRLKRFDMSEFASADGFTRLIGGHNENGLLTDAVRQHPFSVVLLDEIEKAHLKVFDLCLQIFDAGRLTDGRGRTVDFRRTIVILTSNIGATAASTPLGFAAPGQPPPVDADRERTFRELSQFFRPEFLNRLDRIVQFRSLSLRVAEQIARREVDLVLQRSGIRRRQLVVDIDPGAVALLVREGYSSHFGARPLKRTIERLLLLPLARAISSGSLRERTLLRLTEQNGRVEAIVMGKPEVKTPEPSQKPAPWRVRLVELQDAYGQMKGSMQPLVDRKSELITQTQQRDFFRKAEVRSATLGEIHNLDQILNMYHGIGKALAGIQERLDRAAITRAEEGVVKERLERLGAEIVHLKFVSHCKDSRDLGDALIILSLLDRSGTPQDAVQRLAGMYQALAAQRRMHSEVLGEFYDEKRDRVYLLISGLGAFGLLKHESGLHQVERRYKERTVRSGKEVIRESRELLRIEIHAAGTEPSKQLRQAVKPSITLLKPTRARLIKADLALSVFNEDSVRSVEFWTSGPKTAALERALMVLQAQGVAASKGPARDLIVRHYDVGMSPKVKDTRTGRSTTRLDRVMDGDLGIFLQLDALDRPDLGDTMNRPNNQQPPEGS